MPRVTFGKSLPVLSSACGTCLDGHRSHWAGICRLPESLLFSSIRALPLRKNH